MNIVQTKGTKINKGLRQQRKKFLDGFPESFNNIIGPERLRGDDGSYIHEPLYPAHHPLAGQANPNTGRPDLEKMARAYAPEWDRRCRKGLIKRIPRGFANAAEEGEPSDAERPPSPVAQAFANAVARSKITSKWICSWCGGRGHATNVDGTECLTKQLGIRIAIDDLKQTKYPGGLKYPEFPPRKGKAKAIAADNSDADSDNSDSDNETAQEIRKMYKDKYKQKYKKKYGSKKHVKKAKERAQKAMQEDSSEVESSDEEEVKQVNRLRRFDVSTISTNALPQSVTIQQVHSQCLSASESSDSE